MTVRFWLFDIGNKRGDIVVAHIVEDLISDKGRKAAILQCIEEQEIKGIIASTSRFKPLQELFLVFAELTTASDDARDGPF